MTTIAPQNEHQPSEQRAEGPIFFTVYIGSRTLRILLLGGLLQPIFRERQFELQFCLSFPLEYRV